MQHRVYIRLFFLSLLLLFGASSALAATHRVSNSSELLTAVANANPGDKILLNPNNYGSITISGRTFSSAVIIESVTTSAAIFTNFKIEDSNHIRVVGIKIQQAASTNYGFHVVDSNNIGLENSTIFGEDLMTGKNIFLSNTDSVSLLGNDISTTNDGIHATGALTNALFEGNSIITRTAFVVPSAHDDSIQLRAGPVRNLRIKRNVLAYSDQNIFLQTIGSGPWENITISGNISLQEGTDFSGKHVFLGPVSNVIVEGNTFTTNGGGYAHGINISVTGTYVVKGNIFWNSLYMSKASGSNSDYNLFYDTTPKQVLTGYNSFAAYRAANPTNDVYSLEGDPRFVDIANGNARIATGSPAINSGTPLSSLALDIDGNTRPALGAWDMGAHEFGSTSADITPPAAPRQLRFD